VVTTDVEENTIPISRSRSIENVNDRREGGSIFQIPFLATLSAPTRTTAPKISPSNSLKDELFRTASRKYQLRATK
jgi:hypothetical protein